MAELPPYMSDTARAKFQHWSMKSIRSGEKTRIFNPQLLGQVHLAQNRVVARVTFEALGKRVTFARPEMDILPPIGPPEPLERQRFSGTIRIDFGNLRRRVVGIPGFE